MVCHTIKKLKNNTKTEKVIQDVPQGFHTLPILFLEHFKYVIGNMADPANTNKLRVTRTCSCRQQLVEFLHPAAPWVVVMGNIETDARVRCVGQQLAHHNHRAQFEHPGFLVVAQTKVNRKNEKTNEEHEQKPSSKRTAGFSSSTVSFVSQTSALSD